MRRCKAEVCWILLVLLIIPAELNAQQPLPAPPAAPLMETLKILVLEGEGAINTVDKYSARPMVVEVRDQNDRPVEGAEVIFRLPPSGPGGSFPDKKPSRTARTNVQGQALASAFTPNNQTGRFKIHVTATFANQVGEADITQMNALLASSLNMQKLKPPKRFPLWKIIAIAGGGAAAIALIVVLTTGGDKTITILPGPVTIGGR